MERAVNYERTGLGPDLVLIHSLGADLGLWDEVVDAFSARYRVLRYDVRGHGRSTAPCGEVSIDLLRNDLRALLDDLHIERAHIAGLSMGGMIAMAFAAAHPARVDRLVLADTASEFDPPIRTAWHERAAAARRDGMATLVEATVERWFPKAFRRSGDRALERVRTSIATIDPQHYAAAGEALEHLDLTARLPSIRARTLVAVGELDEAIPPRYSEHLRDRIAGAELRTWPGVGHCPPLQIPGQFAADVLAFLSPALSS